MDQSKQQTAVEWLFNELDYILELYPSRSEKVKMFFKQAKAMEKEQIEDAYEQGYNRVVKLIEDATQRNL